MQFHTFDPYREDRLAKQRRDYEEITGFKATVEQRRPRSHKEVIFGSAKAVQTRFGAKKVTLPSLMFMKRCLDGDDET